MVGKLRYYALHPKFFCPAFINEKLTSWLYSLPTHTMSYWSKLSIDLSPDKPDVDMECLLGSSRRKTFDQLGITH